MLFAVPRVWLSDTYRTVPEILLGIYNTTQCRLHPFVMFSHKMLSQNFNGPSILPVPQSYHPRIPTTQYRYPILWQRLALNWNCSPCRLQPRTRRYTTWWHWQAVKHNFFIIGTTDARVATRSFLCFYSAIFQLTSAKFQTFAYNSRTVRSSCMKFWQQFEINELHVCTKFRGNRSRNFGFRTRKPPRKFGVKSVLSQKRLK